MATRQYQPDPPTRPTIMGTHGVVSSGHALASQAGLDVLKSGGNAVDAAIATSAVLGVVRPHMTGIGGDLFATIYTASDRRVTAINASGPAPRTATRAAYRERGFRTIPNKGMVAVETPGGVAGWEAALGRFGTRGLGDLLGPAIAYAEDGFPVYPRLNTVTHDVAPLMNDDARNLYAPGGRPVPVGHLLRNPGLGRSLRAIAADGADVFYRGEIARALAAYSRANNGFLDEPDLADMQAEVLDPIVTSYRGYSVWEQPPVSQGHILLEMLNIIEGYDLGSLGWNSPEAIHVMVEAKKIAFADRLRYAGDPVAGVHIPLEQILSKEYAEEARRLINPDRAMHEAPRLRELAHVGADTTYLTVADRDGNVVSMIQSLYNPFGSGVLAGETGIMLNNRMSGFWLEDGHPNALEPGKRTVHTLNTLIITRDNEFFMSGGTPGADHQVQTNLQVIANVIDFGMDIQQAIEATKWWSGPGTTEPEKGNGYVLHVEGRMPAEVIPELERRGHQVQVGPNWSIGSNKGILRHPETGVWMAGAQPSRDAYAVGW